MIMFAQSIPMQCMLDSLDELSCIVYSDKALGAWLRAVLQADKRGCIPCKSLRIQPRIILVKSVIFGYPNLCSNLLKPLHHTEHDAHRDEAYYCEYCPALPDWPCVIHERTEEKEEVSDCGRTKPETLTETEHALRSHLRYE